MSLSSEEEHRARIEALESRLGAMEQRQVRTERILMDLQTEQRDQRAEVRLEASAQASKLDRILSLLGERALAK